MKLDVGVWARSRLAEDAGRVFRLMESNKARETWLCGVVDVESGRLLYKVDVRDVDLRAIEPAREPLLFITLVAIAGSAS